MDAASRFNELGIIRYLLHKSYVKRQKILDHHGIEERYRLVSRQKSSISGTTSLVFGLLNQSLEHVVGSGYFTYIIHEKFIFM